MGAIVVRVATDAETSAALRTAVRALLDGAFGGHFSDHDWDHTAGGWRVVALVDDAAPVAHAAIVPRRLHVDGRPFSTGYVEGVATAPDRQGIGVGARVMGAATDVVREHFELGALSTSVPVFYERLGWERWRGPTFVRRDDAIVRTPHEDDGVMVLRTGASTAIDLTAPIACEARPGDDW